MCSLPLLALSVVFIIATPGQTASGHTLHEARIRILLNRIECGEPDEQRDAIEELGQYRAAVPQVIETLIGTLKSDAPQPDNPFDRELLRHAARDALVRIGRPAVPALTKALDIDDAQLLNHAFIALREIGPAAVDAAPRLAHYILAGDEHRSQDAWMSLRAMDAAAIPAWLELAQTKPEAGVRNRALLCLGAKIGDPKLVVPVLLHLAQDPDRAFRRLVYTALRQYGTHAANAIPLIVADWESETDPNAIRGYAANLGPLGDVGETYLLRMLKDPDPNRQAAAIFGLGFAEHAVVPLLTEHIDSGNLDCRLAAVRALGGRTSEHDAAMAALAKALHDDDIRVRMNACNSVGNLGPPSGPTGGPLRDLLRDQSVMMRGSAAHALEGFPDDALRALPTLIEICAEDHGYVANFALPTIRALGPQAARAIPVLIHVATQPRNRLSGQFRSFAPQPNPDIPNSQRDESWRASASDLQYGAMRALTAIGPQAVPAMINGTKSAPEETVWLIHDAIKQMGTPAIAVLKAERDKADEHLRRDLDSIIESVEPPLTAPDPANRIRYVTQHLRSDGAKLHRVDRFEEAEGILTMLAQAGLANLPPSADYARYGTTAAFLVTSRCLRFEARPEDLERFLAQSPALENLAPVAFSTHNALVAAAGQAGSVPLRGLSTPSGLPWFRTSDCTLGRFYQLPQGDQHHGGRVIIDDATRFVYIELWP